ncbi:cyanophycinase CphB [Mycobacterium liflandii 128FXT]|uniref:Cyanophycinase n=1 Tax=Mycobacterium liflandii (strain 128FXT) TaxID=459424 RepID=L7V8R4_MYCL1|nr:MULTISPECIES: cyanophycinase [Mycobacterium ulcerans group]AGC62930.1 cyanophycinase CphB [Mycobacterium liflandii 128FXT]
MTRQLSRISLTDRGSATPKLAIIGGRLEDDNAAVYHEMHRLAGGRIVVFPTASSVPDEVGAEAVGVFRAYGFDAALAGVYGAGAAAAAQDTAIADLVEDYGSVYFTGGDQALITGALAPKGTESRVLKAIRTAQLNGAMVAGSSAGAAMMSDVMISGGTSLEAATYGVVDDPDEPGMLLEPGLGFFPWGMVDQHFIKRGRFGRLVVGMQASGAKRGFGIDENTALFIEGTSARVIGEYGAFVLHLQEAKVDRRRKLIENIGFSYADDGDSYDLETGEVLPGPSKRPVTQRDITYRAPARSLRNVFAAYTLYDLTARLVLGDPEAYPADRARAIEPKAGAATSVEISRQGGRAAAYIPGAGRDFRMTAVDFRASMRTRQLNAAQLAENRWAALSRDYGMKSGQQARMMMLGSAPLDRGSPLLAELAAQCEGPVGVLAAASAEPNAAAREYIGALRGHGVEATDLRVTIDNVDRRMREEALVEQIAALRTIILTGGNQIRLVESLLYRGDVTPLLTAIARARAAGAMIVGVGGAASALSGFMIGGGTSYEALRFGIASDMGRHGLVIQEGLGFFGAAIVDQKLSSSLRLGRLAVACAEESVRFGLGLLEDSGVIANHDNTQLTAIGARGAVLVELDPLKTELAGDDFIAPDTKLCFAGPGDVIDMVTGTVTRAAPATASAAALDTLVDALIKDCVGDAGPVTTPGATHEAHIALRYRSHDDGTGHLDIESIRDRHG